jgi:hypothetical protein
MTRRLLFLSVGLLAILASSTPSHADLTLVTANSILGPPLPSGVTDITEIDVTFTSAASPFTDLTLVTPPTAGGSSISSSGDTVSILIAPSASQAYILLGQGFANFHFDVPTDPATAMADVKVTSTEWKTDAGTFEGSTRLSFTAIAVPEPSTAIVAAFGAVAFIAYGSSRHRRDQRQPAAP